MFTCTLAYSSLVAVQGGLESGNYNYLYNFPIHISILFFPGAGNVRFSLRGATYHNNSIVTLEDIGVEGDALLCMTNLTACCQGQNGFFSGSWFFPNGTRVQSQGYQGDFYRTRGQMVVQLHRRRGGVEGIYHCEITDSMYITQNMYIGVYTAKTGE